MEFFKPLHGQKEWRLGNYSLTVGFVELTQVNKCLSFVSKNYTDILVIVTDLMSVDFFWYCTIFVAGRYIIPSRFL